MRRTICFCLGLVVSGWVTGPADGQFQGGKVGLRQVFDLASRGRGYFLVTEMGPLKGALMEYARRHGITDGKVTFDHFTTFAEELKAQAKGIAPSAPPMGSEEKKASPPPRGSPESIKLWAVRDFKRRDRNGDGSLNFEEMSSTLRGDLYHWDKSRNNLIELEEYQAYFLERVQRRSRGTSAPQPLTIIIEEALDERPQVFRAGNLPEKGLPDWFEKLDEDKDGQVGLYEWYQEDRELAEFTYWDRDNDGLITPQEAIRRQEFLEDQKEEGDRGD